VKCAVCGGRVVGDGVLCEPCSEALDGSSPIWPEQIDTRGVRGTEAASLVDTWGMPHHLDEKTSVGRSIEAAKLIVLDGSVSRRHAELELASGTWTIRDVGSMHGTLVNEQKVDQPTPLKHGDRLRFGDIAMFFVASAPRIEQRFDIATYRLPKPQDGMPELPIALHVPSGGGGGVAVIVDKRIQLTTPQYELVDLLVQRMRADAGKPPDTRGFVPVSALLRLSLDVADPGEQHVRQLVYRVRRLLLNAGIGDLIEVRRGVGYRLRVVPRP